MAFPVVLHWRLQPFAGDPDALRRVEANIFGDDPENWVLLEDGTVARAPKGWDEAAYQRGVDVADRAEELPTRRVEVTDVEAAWDWVLGDEEFTQPPPAG